MKLQDFLKIQFSFSMCILYNFCLFHKLFIFLGETPMRIEIFYQNKFVYLSRHDRDRVIREMLQKLENCNTVVPQPQTGAIAVLPMAAQ